MTDVQVSNARRIIFTALAVVSLWVLACGAYGHGSDVSFNGALVGFRRGHGSVKTIIMLDVGWMAIAPAYALVPALFQCLSAHNSPWTTVRDPWTWISMILFTATTAIGFFVGAGGSGGRVEEWWDSQSMQQRDALLAGREVVDLYLTRNDVSPLWLLLPLTLTSAFVIFGAWRRAVRDAEVEAVGEDE